MDFTPDELDDAKEDYLKEGKLNQCPFCLAHTNDESKVELKINKCLKVYECMECGAKWHISYQFENMHMMRVPSRLTLCSQHDKLIYDAIARLKEHGDEYMANRLEKLFTGGYRNAVV
jgi:hypothetical protein